MHTLSEDCWLKTYAVVCPSSNFYAYILPWQALDHSDSVRDALPHLARIFSATRGVVFLGTPHRGSGLASLTKVVASVAQIALQNVNDNLFRELERDSSTLDRIRDRFSRILDKRVVTIWSFVEELTTTGVGKVFIRRLHAEWYDLIPNPYQLGRGWRISHHRGCT